MGIFSGHIHFFGNAVLGKCYKMGIGKYINNFITGIQHFFFKRFGYKNRRFCIAKIQGAGMQRFNFLHVSIIFFCCKSPVELLS